MARKASSSHARRTSSVATAKPLAHVAESESERDDAPANSAKAVDEELQEMERLEAERDARFQEAERELMSALESEDVSEHARKRQLTRLFDRFRYEYTQLSNRFRENLRLQRKIMDKCHEMKNELVMSAIKIKTSKQLQDDEMKNLLYYRDECEHAWKEAKLCEERERDAVSIIDELKNEVEELQAQLKSLLGLEIVPRRAALVTPTSPSRYHHDQESGASEPSTLSPVRSPLKRIPHASSGGGSPSLSPSKTKGRLPTQDQPALMSFEEWKASNRVWSPAMEHETRKAPIPTQEQLFLQERKLDIARCVSVPTFQPTPMERAATAVALSSPSRREQRRKAELEARRASTSIGTKRSPAPSSSQPLPSVSTRRTPPA